MTSPLFLPTVFSLFGVGFLAGRWWDRIVAYLAPECPPTRRPLIERSNVVVLPSRPCDLYDWQGSEGA